MTLLDLHTSVPVIYLAWWLLALPMLFYEYETSVQTRLQQSHNFLLGVMAVIISISKLLYIFFAATYWREQLAFYEGMAALPIFIFFALEYLVIFMPIINLRRKHRTSLQKQFLLLVLIGCYLITNFWMNGVSFTDWATSVIPGWHTTIFGPFGIEFTPIFFLGFLIVAWLLQRTNWLPEHRQVPT